ncbi:hypothetical protein [Psychromarinibacter sp. S121]|uniref:hypothetical protein n=1 Tax=Psychromarinibacter sp. S121 TaxID=3415127 RepID=UPI003C7B4F31
MEMVTQGKIGRDKMSEHVELSTDDLKLVEAEVGRFTAQVLSTCRYLGGDALTVAARLNEFGRQCQAEADVLADFIRHRREQAVQEHIPSAPKGVH